MTKYKNQDARTPLSCIEFVSLSRGTFTIRYKAMFYVRRFTLLVFSACLGLFSADGHIQARQSPGGDDVSWATAGAKADAFLAQLTLDEKIELVAGADPLTTLGCIGNISPISRLNFSGICYSDSGTGVNRADLVSVFPAGLTAAATWDEDLMLRRGVAIGEEFRGKGFHVVLGPVAGPLGRHPLGGRNWEGFSPDPYLTGVAMDKTIRGIQSNGVQAVAKHFIGNEQETQRTNSTLPDGSRVEAISSNIDDRTLHELYLWPFVDSVKAGTASILCSYNRLNQTYACENLDVLTRILRDEIGFRGYTVSDWYATYSAVNSANAGLDMEMPGNNVAGGAFYRSGLPQAIENGTVSQDRIDEMVRRVMTSYYLLGQDDPSFPTVDPSTLAVIAQQYGQDFGVGMPEARDVRGDHATLIREIGSAGAVLLKNEHGTLPLATPKHIGVFGDDAGDLIDGLTFQDPPSTALGPEFGTLDIGGGSGSQRHTSIVSPLEAIKARAQEISIRVSYIVSNQRLAANDFHSLYPIPEVCIVFIKTFAAESFDRLSFEADWDSTAAVTNVAERCNNTVVVTHSAGVNAMPWATHPNVKAIIAAHFPGEQTGNSIVDILWGDVNPSGRLPYTIPVTEEDYGFPIVNLTSDEVTSPTAWQSNFTEGLLIDYRHFDAMNIEPLYEFGFGLSYTTFELVANVSVANLVTNPAALASSTAATEHGDIFTPFLNATSRVSNTGSRDGAAVVQLYVSMPRDSVPTGTPVRILRGFTKPRLAEGEAKDVEFQLTRRDLSYWDVTAQNWRVPTGEFEICVGFSSRDLPQCIKHTIL
ncbi:glycoside hydrolase superfamily [Xylaria sp. FL1042]|nr:glycoside hydrolase superfamily [Xylaria sp. FL1042]